MSKYAITICSGIPYLAGLNAILNAIEFYGMRNIDVHISSTKYCLQEYYEYIKHRFSYNIFIHYLEDLCGIEHELNIKDDIDFYYIWSKYGVGLKIQNDYDAILHLDARCCPITDITSYFTIAEKTGFVIGVENPRYRFNTLEAQNKQTDSEIEHFCFNMPFLNFIFFYKTKEHTDLLEYMWERRDCYKELRKTCDPYRLTKKVIDIEDGPLFIKGLFVTKKLEKLFLLPNISWVSDYALYRTPLVLTHDKQIIFDIGEKVKLIRGRYYYREEYNIYDLTTEQRKNLYETTVFKNVQLLTQLIRFLNYNCTVTLDEVKKIHDKYFKFLHLIDHYNNTI